MSCEQRAPAGPAGGAKKDADRRPGGASPPRCSSRTGSNSAVLWRGCTHRLGCLAWARLRARLNRDSGSARPRPPLYKLGHARGRRIAASTEQGRRPMTCRDPSIVTVTDIMDATGISRRLVTVWIEMGLLPMPRRVPLGAGFFNCFPYWTIDRARFIVEKRAAGFTYEQVQAMLDGHDDPPPRGGAVAGVA